MADDKSHGAGYGFSEEAGVDQGHFDVPASPKHHKKDTKRYVAFHSDELDSSEIEEETPRKDRKKLKKDRSNTFREKFKSIKVKKKEKESKEKSKEKEKEKEERKEKKEKKKHKRSLSAGDTLSSIQIQSPPPVAPVFGVPIEVAVARSRLSDGIELPYVFRECLTYLEEKGIDQEGIYRISGIKSKIDELKSLYNHGMKVDLEAEDIEPNIVAGLLKLYLRDLPVNILTPKLLPVFDSLVGIKDELEQIDKMQQLLASLPTANFTLLSWLFVHLDHVMAKGSETKMGIQNISIVFSPTMNISHGVLFIIMTHIKEFFPDVKIVKYVEPVKSKADPEVPHSPRSLEEELSKQEVFLDNLHQRMKTDEADEDEVMEQMWDIQRTVTQLKRRLKTIRKSQPLKDNTEAETQKADSEVSDLTKAKVTQSNEATGQQRRDKMQQEIDQGKTKLQALIKEESKTRQEQEVHEDNVRKKREQNFTKKEVKPIVEKKRLVEYVSVDKHEKQEDLVDLEKKKIEEARRQKRNEEHNRILEKSKEIALHSRDDGKEIAKPKEEVTQEHDKNDDKEKEAKSEEFSADRVEVQVDDQDDEEIFSDDDEIAEMLREEYRLMIEQEELLSLSAQLKDRIQSEWNDVDRLQLEIDEMRKRPDQASSLTSSSNEGSSSGSSGSGTDSDEDNSDLEDILKELEKENEKLENETVDLMKALEDERGKILQLNVDIRMMEGCEI